MFGNFSLPELLVVAALALIVIGPKDLPRMMRSVGKFVGQARGLARQFQDSMNDAAREADLDEFREARKLLKGGKSGVTDLLNEKLDADDEPKKSHSSTTSKDEEDELAGNVGFGSTPAEPEAAMEPIAKVEETPRTADAKSG